MSRELNTSPILPGDDISSKPSVRVSVTGNNLLVNTAITEARMVLNMYRIITVFITPPWLFPEWHKELMTSTKTRSGAIALSAPTKTLPKRAMPEAFGTSRPRIIPSASPPIILLMRLILIHLSNNFFINNRISYAKLLLL